jgi:uncharacterized protein
MFIGTLANVATVIVGSIIGLLLQSSLPERIRKIVFQAIGLFTVVYGVMMALKLPQDVKYVLALVFSLLIGGVLGEWLDLQGLLERLGDWLKKRIARSGDRFTEGLVTAFLIYCIGPMTLIGSLNSGLRGDNALLFTKATLDGFMSIALASTYGIGVMLSAIPLFLFQAAVTLLGMGAQHGVSEVLINMLTATGGVLILGLGLNLLDVAKLRITNLLPALAIVAVVSAVIERFLG